VCLTNWPWSSWYLHDRCHRYYYIEILNEFWPGANNEQFQRYENTSESVLLAAANHPKLYKDRTSAWFEEDDLPVFLSGANSIPFSKLAEQRNISQIFLSGGIPVNDRMGDLLAKYDIHARKKATTRIVFSELLLSNFLPGNYEILAEKETLIHRYDVPRLYRELGIWWMGSGFQLLKDELVIQFTLGGKKS